jgi:hypothetical protein
MRWDVRPKRGEMAGSCKELYIWSIGEYTGAVQFFLLYGVSFLHNLLIIMKISDTD